MISQIISEYINSKKSELIKFTKELISIPTVNPPGEHYELIVDLLEDRCRQLGLATKRIEVSREELKRVGISGGSRRISLIAEWDTHCKKTLHINGHYDVVPPGSNWHTDPFKPVIEKGRLYGRGAEDMKGDIACIIFAVEAIKRCSITPGINLQLSFTPDEEIGGRSGLGYLVGKGLIHPDYAIGEGYAGNFVSIGNKGILWVEIALKGKSAHGSRPHKGINAFEKMLSLSHQLERLKKRVEKKCTKYYTKYYDDRFATFVMGGLNQGGNKTNTVPDKAMFSIDRRILPEEKVTIAEEEILNVIRQAKRKDKTLRVKVTITARENPAISKDSKLANAVAGAIKEIVGRNAYFAIMPGGNDLRYFIWKGIPAVGYSVLGGERWHSDDEFVYIDSLMDTAKVYAMTIMMLCKQNNISTDYTD